MRRRGRDRGGQAALVTTTTINPREAAEQAQRALAEFLDRIGDREMTPDEIETFDRLDAATIETEAAYYASLSPAERYVQERVTECEVEVQCREAGIPYDPH